MMKWAIPLAIVSFLAVPLYKLTTPPSKNMSIMDEVYNGFSDDDSLLEDIVEDSFDTHKKKKPYGKQLAQSKQASYKYKIKVPGTRRK